MEGLEISGLFTALVQLRENILKRDALSYHHNGQMIDQIGDLVNRLAVISVFCGDNSFAALLPDLLQDLVDPLIEQIAGVGALLGIISSVFDRLVKRGENCSVVHQ